MRGQQLNGVIHISDWWPTFASLAGLPVADVTGPTPTDGIDQSAYIFGKVATSPRKETVLDHLMHCVVGPGIDPEQCVAGQTPDFPAGVSASAAAAAAAAAAADAAAANAAAANAAAANAAANATNANPNAGNANAAKAPMLMLIVVCLTFELM